MLFSVGSIVFTVWVLFFGGAARLENMFLADLENGVAGEKEKYIKMVAGVFLVWSIFDLIRWVLF